MRASNCSWPMRANHVLETKNRLGQKLWATDSESIRPLLGWEFWVQDLLHELEVLLASLTYLIAYLGWAYAKGLKGTNPFSPNHTPSISPICSHEFEPCLKGKIYNTIQYMNWACKNMCHKNRYQQLVNFDFHLWIYVLLLFHLSFSLINK